MKAKWMFGLLFWAMTVAVQANPITRHEARQVAQELVGIDDATTDNDVLAPYYLFSRGQGQGFVIVSGDDTTAPILGYTERGDYDERMLPEQLLLMMKSWKERIEQVQKNPQTGPRRAPRARAIASYKKDWEDVPALVKTHWHQSTPYNNLAPIKEGVGRCMTGCVATAGSQVTYYFHKDNPNELQYDTPTYGYGTPITVSLPKGTPIRWDLMKLSGSGTAAQDEAVATLMYALGTSAWLTYGDGEGSATSGHNDKMAEAMKGQFRLNYTHKEKSSTSQQSWETTIYRNLKNRQPMLYSGVHPDQGGHSVVLDGYQKSTGLYHFNFGWGGQGDGYYTVDDATGMNGFNAYQDLIYDITPQIQNLAGAIEEAPLYHKALSQIEAVVKNNGTLDYSQLFIYTNNAEVLSSQIAGRDTKTIIEPGQEARLSFNITPTTKGPLYVFLCDKNRRVLDTCLLQVEATVADLRLNQMSVDAGSAVTTVDDIDFKVVNNTTVNVLANLTNGEAGTYCMPTIQCYLDKYDTETKEWSRATNLILNSTTFEQGQTQSVCFTFSGLTEGTLYRAYMNHSTVASEVSEIQMPETGETVCFTIRKADLTLVNDGRKATVSGHWNASLFSQLATDASVCSYDISALEELSEQPITPNPNALFFATSETEAMQTMKNIVVGDNCRQLEIQRGADFAPLRAFTAQKATFIMPEATAGKWQSAIIPFTAQVPFGMQVKQMSSWSGDVSTFSHTLEVAPFTPIVCLTGHNALNAITAEHVAVTTDTLLYSYDDQLVCATVGRELQSTWLVLGDWLAATYFIPANNRTEAVAFEPYIINTKASRHISTTSETVLDAYYKELSTSINKVYVALAERGFTPQQATEALQSALNEAEQMLTNRSGATSDDINNERKALDQALADWLDYYTQGIEDIVISRFGSSDESANSKSARNYFDLTGKRIDHPTKGLYIVRQGAKTKKILIK